MRHIATMHLLAVPAMLLLAFALIGAYLAAAVIGDRVGKALRRPLIGWAVGGLVAIGIAGATIAGAGGPAAIRCHGPDPRNPCNVDYGGGDWDAH